jgi:nucleoid-associated protein YgaU
VTVQQGESLSLITLREWDDALLWPLLYDANQTTIGPNHNLIHPGMQLTVPSIANLSQAELERVRQRGRNWN